MTQGPGGRASPGPPAPPEPEAPTTFCALLPRMPQWKFAAPVGFLGRGQAAARAAGDAGVAGGTDPQPESVGPASIPALAAAVLNACEPRCAAPCPLPALSRCRTAGPRGPRGARGTAGPPDAGADEWIRKGSFIHKPAHGWLHPDARVLGSGVSYIVRYMGCIEVLCSMRSLDFNTRTQVTREAINRLHEAVPGVRGSWKKKAPNKALASILGKSNLRFAGMSISISISTDGLNLSVPATRQIIANHHMQSISFASGGDTDMTDYVAYVAKDPINQRACHILECCEGLAQSVISTVGQAFELRFKQYLHSTPKGASPRRDARGLQWELGLSAPPGDGYVQADARGPRDYEDHLYVNTQGLDAPEPLQPEDSPKKDLFDMRPPFPAGGSCRLPASCTPSSLAGPFEDALKLHECSVAVGTAADPLLLEDQWPSPPTRRAPIAPTEEQLRQEPWYHGQMSRRTAEKLLRADGDFLVRDSVTNPGQYVLTGMHAGQPKHLLLVDPEGVVMALALAPVPAPQTPLVWWPLVVAQPFLWTLVRPEPPLSLLPPHGPRISLLQQALGWAG
ncbi:PREDICTED: SHC-transforming protein 2 isoform X6 [Hipposideros armiger]|uniref:SHC-transforming protein 2 isoform X6 n=1 Tax=Hipposideros armiger TaxID=186990 RepID=A0A8B7SKA0_HIPAR|nr:PREDICTED: SHC-transforming protein 2 isoform X6 [Hipposideros armiger]